MTRRHTGIDYPPEPSVLWQTIILSIVRRKNARENRSKPVESLWKSSIDPSLVVQIENARKRCDFTSLIDWNCSCLFDRTLPYVSFFLFFPRRSHQDYRVTFWKHLKMATQCARTPTYTQTSHTHTQILQTHKVERTGGRAGWEHSCRGHDSRRAKSFEALNSLLSAQIFLHKVDVMNNPAVQCSLFYEL